MVSAVIVVNGVPGSGKTTLSAPLAALLGVPLIAKDALKEALSDAVGGGLPTSPLGRIALDALWRIAALHDGTVMLESFWATGRDEPFFRRGYESLGAPPGVELWCEVPLEEAARRFVTRPRHSAHQDRDRIAEMRALVSRSAPISGLPLIEVDTTSPVDLPALAARIRSALPAIA